MEQKYINNTAALATTVGVLTVVPVMLLLIKLADSTQRWFLEENKC